MLTTAPPFTPCLLIPCYNHGPALLDTLQALARSHPLLQLPCIVVDDGSDAMTAELLDSLPARYPGLQLVRHAVNRGKGAAVITGLQQAAALGFSHALQLDADGQHDLGDLPALLALAQQTPQALISGAPVYDASAPAGRRYGRYLTHVWVWIETASLEIQDSMCGYRVYPLAAVMALLQQVQPGLRMDFDIEIMVRLYWAGVPVRFLPTRVHYPANGLSHFDVWRDNLRISWMHTRLVTERLLGWPQRWWRRRHWSRTPERGAEWGLRLMRWSYDRFGRRGFQCLLYPVITYFWLTGVRQRRASQVYLSRVRAVARRRQLVLPDADKGSWHHFVRFGEAMLDKLAGWRGEIGRDQIRFHGEAHYQDCLQHGGGQLILGSHLGDLELCRALGTAFGEVTINALVFTRHAERFNRLLASANPAVRMNLICVQDLGPETAMQLKQKLDAGEWVVMVGDRTSATRERRVIQARFLDAQAPFPQGPFALAAVLGVPVSLLFGLRIGGRFEVFFEPFSAPIQLPRQARQAVLAELVQRYADRLEHYCLQAPLDWFNFYDFWQLSDDDSA